MVLFFYIANGYYNIETGLLKQLGEYITIIIVVFDVLKGFRPSSQYAVIWRNLLPRIGIISCGFCRIYFEKVGHPKAFTVSSSTPLTPGRSVMLGRSFVARSVLRHVMVWWWLSTGEPVSDMSAWSDRDTGSRGYRRQTSTGAQQGREETDTSNRRKMGTLFALF